MTSAKPVRVYATGNGSLLNKKFDDAILCILEFDEGAIASIDSNWVLPLQAPRLESGLRIVGTKGVVDVAGDQGLTEVTAGAGVVVPDLSLRPVVVGDTLEGALKRAIDHFVTCVLEGKDPSVGPLEGRDALKVALALEESARSHKPVRLDW